MTHWSGFDATADRRLLKKLAEGDESALADVYDIYAERLYDYAMLFTGDVHTARGMVHDTLIDASRRAPRLRDRRHLRPWLYGAVRRRGMARRRDGWSPPDRESDPVELRVAYAALAALDRGQRDALYLAYRHDVEGADLAATLGVAQRRARRQVARATARAEQEVTRAYAGTPDAPTAIELVRMLPVPEPPEALRDRVLHTAADPQLARYRAQIVARGGRLVAVGLPRQPDAPSQVVRRYAVGGTAMAAFLGVVTIGLNVVDTDTDRGPSLGRPAPSWTTAPDTGTPAPTTRSRKPGDDHPVAVPTDPAGRRGHARDGAEPGGTPHPGGGTPTPRPSTGNDPAPPPGRSPTAPPSPGPGTLTVRPAEIRLGGTSDSAVLTLTAEDGAVKWSASSASPALSLSSSGGTIAAGGTRRVTVRLARNKVLQLPGSSQVTVAGAGTHAVPVNWSISVLAR